MITGDMGYRGYGTHGQWGTRIWDTWAIRYRGMGHMGNGVQGYGAHVWAMRYRGMGHMGNGVQGYGAHGQWHTGVWGT